MDSYGKSNILAGTGRSAVGKYVDSLNPVSFIILQRQSYFFSSIDIDVSIIAFSSNCNIFYLVAKNKKETMNSFGLIITLRPE